MFKGEVDFINNIETKKQVFKTMIHQLEPNPDARMDDILNSEGISTTIVGRIKIEYMTGKKSSSITF
jgi:hypothetical protein